MTNYYSTACMSASSSDCAVDGRVLVQRISFTGLIVLVSELFSRAEIPFKSKYVKVKTVTKKSKAVDTGLILVALATLYR